MQRFEADNGIAVGLAVALKFSGESIPIWVDMQVCVCFGYLWARGFCFWVVSGDFVSADYLLSRHSLSDVVSVSKSPYRILTLHYVLYVRENLFLEINGPNFSNPFY